jgi:hypothetical protein
VSALQAAWSHYARKLRRHGSFFSPGAWDVQSNRVNNRCAPFGVVGPIPRLVSSVSGFSLQCLTRPLDKSICHSRCQHWQSVFAVRAVKFLGTSNLWRYVLANIHDRISFLNYEGPAAPPYYSSTGFGPSNRFLWASSASILFESGLRSLELFSLGQQRLHIIRVRASVPRIAFFG